MQVLHPITKYNSSQFAILKKIFLFTKTLQLTHWNNNKYETSSVTPKKSGRTMNSWRHLIFCSFSANSLFQYFNDKTDASSVKSILESPWFSNSNNACNHNKENRKATYTDQLNLPK